MKLYNTLSRKKEEFKPLKKGLVRIYVCGPTVNDVPHLGHARQQISFDVLRKYLKFVGHKVNFVSNITDIEDKIINKSKQSGKSIKQIIKENTAAHMQDYKEIGVDKPDKQPKATGYIKQMIGLVKMLEKKGFTYVIKDDGVYYNINKFKKYGKLSGQDIKKLRAGARVKVKYGKKNKEDFALWKFSKPGEPSWSSPWGKGRPGWHIECSAMSSAILGLPLDIHGGGQDLIFPHHEDEIAQSEAGYGKKFSNYWVHNGMVNVNKVKMSKSLGNFRTIRDILKEYPGEVIRYFIISNHYRKPVDFSKKTLEEAKVSYQRLKNIISEVKDDKKTNKKYLLEFEKAMSDDLNTPKALAVLWKMLRDAKAKGKITTIKKIDAVFGLNLLKKDKVSVSANVKKLVKKREATRKAQKWAQADKLRVKINKLGYVVNDTKNGPELQKI